MNPEILNKIKHDAECMVAEIVHAWPTARVRWTLDGMAAVVMVQGETFTYIIEVEGSATRSLWVGHRVPIGPDSTYVPEWRTGWVD